jgi:hypothetical protein
MLGLGNILTKGGAVLGFPNKYSFNFDGSNDYLETADNESFDFGTGDFSISFWFNVNDIDWNWAVSRANSANSADLYRAGTNNSGKIIFRDIAGGTDIVGSTTVSIKNYILMALRMQVVHLVVILIVIKDLGLEDGKVREIILTDSLTK